MKKQINPTIKAYLIRGGFYLLLLLAVCAIPFALAQRSSATRSTARVPAHRNLTVARPVAGATHSALANPDFAQPSHAVHAQQSSILTRGTVTLAPGNISATGAAGFNNLLKPLIPSGGCV